jgi:hypothetical protein
MVNKTLDLILISKWKPGSKQQAEYAKKLHATHILFRPDEISPPKWVKEELAAKGYAAVKIGRTTYKSNTYAVFKVT